MKSTIAQCLLVMLLAASTAAGQEQRAASAGRPLRVWATGGIGWHLVLFPGWSSPTAPVVGAGIELGARDTNSRGALGFEWMPPSSFARRGAENTRASLFSILIGTRFQPRGRVTPMLLTGLSHQVAVDRFDFEGAERVSRDPTWAVTLGCDLDEYMARLRSRCRCDGTPTADASRRGPRCVRELSRARSSEPP